MYNGINVLFNEFYDNIYDGYIHSLIKYINGSYKIINYLLLDPRHRRISKYLEILLDLLHRQTNKVKFEILKSIAF